MKAYPRRGIQCYIAEQQMVQVAQGLSCVGFIPIVGTFGAFFSRACDQLRMNNITQAKIKCFGTHVGISIGEDGPSQMALEDIAIFGSLLHSIVLYPSDGVSSFHALRLMAS